MSQGLQADLGRVKTLQVMFYSASLPYFIWNCSWPSCSFQWNTLRHCLFFCRKEERRARGWRRKAMSTSRKEVGWSSLHTLWMLESLTLVLSHHGGCRKPWGRSHTILVEFYPLFHFSSSSREGQRSQTSFRVVSIPKLWVLKQDSHEGWVFTHKPMDSGLPSKSQSFSCWSERASPGLWAGLMLVLRTAARSGALKLSCTLTHWFNEQTEGGKWFWHLPLIECAGGWRIPRGSRKCRFLLPSDTDKNLCALRSR